MSAQPLFTPNGDGYDIQPAGVLLLLAMEVRDNPHKHGRIQGLIDTMLSAARAGGFTQGDILQTLLARGESSPRVRAMAVEACAAAGNEAIAKIFESMRGRSGPTEGAQ